MILDPILRMIGVVSVPEMLVVSTRMIPSDSSVYLDEKKIAEYEYIKGHGMQRQRWPYHTIHTCQQFQDISS